MKTKQFNVGDSRAKYTIQNNEKHTLAQPNGKEDLTREKTESIIYVNAYTPGLHGTHHTFNRKYRDWPTKTQLN